jgi:CBS domain-containing protein
MMVKHVTDLNFADEFVKVTRNTPLRKVVQSLLRPGKGHDVGIECTTARTALVAYVMEGNSPVGVIDKDVLLNASIVEGLDMEETISEQVMKPLVVYNGSTPIIEVVNAIIDRDLLTVAIVEDEELLGVISVFDAIMLQHELDCSEM